MPRVIAKYLKLLYRQVTEEQSYTFHLNTTSWSCLQREGFGLRVTYPTGMGDDLSTQISLLIYTCCSYCYCAWHVLYFLQYGNSARPSPAMFSSFSCKNQGEQRPIEGSIAGSPASPARQPGSLRKAIMSSMLLPCLFLIWEQFARPQRAEWGYLARSVSLTRVYHIWTLPQT